MRSNSWKMIAIFALFLVGRLAAETRSGLVIFWDKPFMSPKEAQGISKFDIAVIDIENCAVNFELLQMMKAMNPDIVLVANIPLTRLRSPFSASFRPIQAFFMKKMESLGFDFWLRDAAGEAVYDPREGGWRVFNVCADSLNRQDRQGVAYINFATKFYSAVLSEYPVWDGFCVDSSWEDVMKGDFVAKHFYRPPGQDRRHFQIDFDLDGQADEPFMFISAWRKGKDDFISLMKENNSRHVALVRQSK
jgi:hypothetical protein